MRKLFKRVAGGVLCLLACPVMAHGPFSSEGNTQLSAIVSAVMLALFCLLYLLGSTRQPPRRWQAFAFQAAVLLSVLAVFGPLDAWAETSTAWHMVQHMLFLVVIAPLWVVSGPLPQFVAGGGRAIVSLARPLLKCARHPLLVAYCQAIIIWFWHIPYFYTLALRDPWWHLTEHLLFLLTAGLFWWVVLRSQQRQIGWALAALLFTLMHTGFLGAVLTFADTPLYGDARGLEDQQLAGLIMWVVGSVPYLLASAWAGHRWSMQMQRRVSGRSQPDAPHPKASESPR